MLAQGMRRAFQTAIHHGGHAVQYGVHLAGVGMQYGGRALQYGGQCAGVGQQALRFLEARASHGVANVAVSLTRQAAATLRREQQRARSQGAPRRSSIETIAKTVTITLGPGACAARESRGRDAETAKATAVPDAALAVQAVATACHGEFPREQSFVT